MAIDRLRSPYRNQIPVGRSDTGPAAYASTDSNYLDPYTFVGDGTAGTVNGVTYRIHRFEYARGQNYSITFDRAGVIDVLVCAGGGAGGGAYHYSGHAASGFAGGGGGGGGLILMYNYGVSASQYNVSVGKGGTGQAGSSGTPTDGENSVFGSLTAIEGGGGCAGWSTNSPQSGGSGGGGASGAQTPYTQGAGTTGQGNHGGIRSYTSAGCGGGGGYLGPGADGTPVDGTDPLRGGGNGGNGIELKFDGVLRGYAAGGGGGCYSSGTTGLGGAGGGGNGAVGGSPGSHGVAATGFGCGGGGASTSTASGNPNYSGGSGSDGVVIVRYAIG
jgi:hypothetical protein